MTYVIFNHKIIKAEEINISPQDRGFRYGDGVFDTMIVSNGKIYQRDFHLARLEGSLKAVKINFDIKNLPEYFNGLITANNFMNGLLRVQITRGISGRGYLPDKESEPTLLMETFPAPALQNKEIKLWRSDYRKIPQKSLPSYAKLCQGLNSTLARIEAAENNCFDSLLLNEKNEICETSSANIFWLKDNILYTPALSCGVLGGSIRSAVIRLSPYIVKEVSSSIEELKNATGVFITNISLKITAVCELKPLDIKWQSDKISAQILKLLEDDIKQLEQ